MNSIGRVFYYCISRADGHQTDDHQKCVAKYAHDEFSTNVEQVLESVALSKSALFKKLKNGDVIVAIDSDRVFSSISDAAITLEKLSIGMVSFYLLDEHGKVTGTNADDSGTLHILIEMSKHRTALRSKQINKKKNQMKDSFLWSGGRKEKGFTVRRIAGKQYQVVDEREKETLKTILAWKNDRDADLLKTGLPYSSCFSVEKLWQIISSLNWKKTGSKKDINGNLLPIRRFGISTLSRLLDQNHNNNVEVRLKRIADCEKRIAIVDGEWAIRKKKSIKGQAALELV